MEVLRKILFIFICVFPLVGVSQINFYKKYTSGPFDQGNGLTQLPDSSYAVTGTSGGFDNNSGQAYLMLTDSLGNQKWTKNYGGNGEDIGVRIIHVPGDGFFIVGHSSSTSNGDFDFVVYKTDETGDLQWEKMYGGPDWEILHDAALLSDGGLILVGETEGQLSQGKDIFMVRITPLGDTVWTKTIQTPEEDFASAVEVVSSTEMIVGGNQGNFGLSKGMLASFHIDGTENWTSFLDQVGVSTVNDITIHQNHVYATGSLENTVENKLDYWTTKTDLNGLYVNHMSYQGHTLGGYFNTIIFNDSSVIYLGIITKSPEVNPYPGGVEAIVQRYNIYFLYLSSHGLSGYDDDYIKEMIVTHDGGVALVGTVSDNQNKLSSGTNVMLVKFGPNNEWTEDADLGNDLVSLMTEQKKTIVVHPNPTNSIVNIPSDLEHQPFELRNLQGQIVKSGKAEPQINLENLEDGIYFLNIIDDKQIWSAKIIKK